MSREHPFLSNPEHSRNVAAHLREGIRNLEDKLKELDHQFEVLSLGNVPKAGLKADNAAPERSRPWARRVALEGVRPVGREKHQLAKHDSKQMRDLFKEMERLRAEIKTFKSALSSIAEEVPPRLQADEYWLQAHINEAWEDKKLMVDQLEHALHSWEEKVSALQQDLGEEDSADEETTRLTKELAAARANVELIKQELEKVKAEADKFYDPNFLNHFDDLLHASYDEEH